MKTIEMTIRATEESSGREREITIEFETPETLDEMVEEYGEDRVFQLAERMDRNDRRNKGSSKIRAGAPDEAVKAVIKDPTTTAKIDPFMQTLSQLEAGDLSEEEIQKLVTSLKKRKEALEQ